MFITLICLVKGDTFKDAFTVDIDSGKLVSHLKDVIKAKKQNDFASVDADRLNLWKIELLATKKISKYFPDSPLKEYIRVLVKGFLNSEVYLSCIPPVIIYPGDASKSRYSTNGGGLMPSRIIRWDGFLERATRFSFNQTPKFGMPQFIEGLRVRVKSSIETAMEVNIFLILNNFLLPEFEFSRQNDSDFNHNDPNIGFGKPDFTCRKYSNPDDYVGKRIIEIEIERDCVIEQLFENDLDVLFRYEDNYPSGCASGDLKNVICQLYNYMVVNELQYGILASYDHHIFFRRPSDNPSELLISEPLALQSTNPPVLKTYAYLVHLAEINPKSPHPDIILGRTRQDSRIQNSVSNNQSFNNQSQSFGLGSNYHNQQDSRDQSSGGRDSTEMQEQTYGYKDFKLEGILGCGQTGRTFKAIFRGEPVALKVIDLYKEAGLLRKIRKEIEIYNILIKIQGRCIPKLVCYGYYGYGMGYFMCITIVGTTLNHHRIDCNQRDRTFEALRAIHSSWNSSQ